MNRAWTIFLGCLLTAALASAQSSDKSEFQEQKRGARSTQGTETRRQTTKQDTVRDTLTVSNEIGVGAIFFPFLKQGEDRQEYRLHYSSGDVYTCSVFSPQYVYADVQGAIQTITTDRPGNAFSAIFHEGAYTTVNDIRQIFRLTAAVKLFGEPEFAHQRLECLNLYANAVDRAVRTLLTQYGDQVRKNPYGEPVYVIPNLREAAARALVGQGNRMDTGFLNYKGSCTMPSANGIQQGANDVRCGVWLFRSQGGDPTLEKSGVKWLAQDYIMGRKVLFAEGRSVETGTTRQASKSVSKTNEKSQDSSTSQGVTVVKPAQ